MNYYRCYEYLMSIYTYRNLSIVLANEIIINLIDLNMNPQNSKFSSSNPPGKSY